jgi:5-methylcytosine-specific restriction endonuclease McrA
MADDTNAQNRLIVTRAEAKAAGSKRYFTGRPCRKGHLSERYVSKGTCSTCAQTLSAKRYSENRERFCAEQRARQAANPEAKRAYNAAYHATHREQIREQKRAWNADNREKRLSYFAAWRAANPERVRANNAAYLAANREERRAACAAYYAANRENLCAAKSVYYVANRETVRAYKAAWRAANPENILSRNRNRRALKKRAGGKHSAADILALFKLQRGKCAHPWCVKRLTSGYHVDHVIPLSRGGSNDRKNLALLCQPCNNQKWAHHPIDFAQRHGMLL